MIVFDFKEVSSPLIILSIITPSNKVNKTKSSPQKEEELGILLFKTLLKRHQNRHPNKKYCDSIVFRYFNIKLIKMNLPVIISTASQSGTWRPPLQFPRMQLNAQNLGKSRTNKLQRLNTVSSRPITCGHLFFFFCLQTFVYGN